MRLPDVISSMSKAGKTRGENLEWGEQFANNMGVFVDIGLLKTEQFTSTRFLR